MTGASPPPAIGPHDVGGRHGFGAIEPESSGAYGFAEPWEGRVVGGIIGAIIAGLFNVDQFRAGIEALPPLAYVRAPYYEKWLHTLERNLVRAGVIEHGELEARVEAVAAEPGAPLPERADPELVRTVRALIEHGAPLVRDIDRGPRFSAGERVHTRRVLIREPGVEHTRLPGYAQGREGEIVRVYEPMPLPDAGVRGEDRAEHVYAVRFDARTLWPDAEPGTSVCVDLFESYLDPVPTPSGGAR